MAFELPPLPYAYDALTPTIDVETMHVHHDLHHATYVKNANAALEGHGELAGRSGEDLLRSLDTVPAEIRVAVRNNVGGHVNHSFFWTCMGPGGGGGPTGELAEAIDSVFGSFESFKTTFNNGGATRFGSGCVWLVLNREGRLEVTSTPNQDTPVVGRRRAAARQRRVGARLLPHLPQPPAGVPGRVVERRRLGRRRPAVRSGEAVGSAGRRRRVLTPNSPTILAPLALRCGRGAPRSAPPAEWPHGLRTVGRGLGEVPVLLLLWREQVFDYVRHLWGGGTLRCGGRSSSGGCPTGGRRGRRTRRPIRGLTGGTVRPGPASGCRTSPCRSSAARGRGPRRTPSCTATRTSASSTAPPTPRSWWRRPSGWASKPSP